ncbi:general stress protein [Aspergillus chevalieri]|uniref:Uncharacterized protein n=1 Tax=Aspergillus chevalieri TaxID=182096 RepID=A0A7R7VWQ0_ASPCH|nr:uncharacterized protein ACHE_80088S [Aspergillus chevalieri]BCR92188.1 hypothetical protein ACHE_80088S [Aspergillus chevalieri]
MSSTQTPATSPTDPTNKSKTSPERAASRRTTPALRIWMNPNKYPPLDPQGSRMRFLIQAQKDIASQGGQASGGSFRPGDPRAREAGHKGGLSGGQSQPEE